MQPVDFEAFRNSLKAQMEFPAVYMFKFILKHELRNSAIIESWFESDAKIQTRLSRNRQYISITVQQTVLSADEVLQYYRSEEHTSELQSHSFIS